MLRKCQSATMVVILARTLLLLSRKVRAKSPTEHVAIVVNYTKLQVNPCSTA